MEDEKIIEVCRFYQEELGIYLEEPYISELYKHLSYMLWRIPQFIRAGRKEKANRWLGFVQGALWAHDDYTIEEMKEHNRPDENK